MWHQKGPTTCRRTGWPGVTPDSADTRWGGQLGACLRWTNSALPVACSRQSTGYGRQLNPAIVNRGTCLALLHLRRVVPLIAPKTRPLTAFLARRPKRTRRRDLAPPAPFGRLGHQLAATSILGPAEGRPWWPQMMAAILGVVDSRFGHFVLVPCRVSGFHGRPWNVGSPWTHKPTRLTLAGP